VEWDPEMIRFYVDDVMYASKTAQDVPPKSKWVFDHPFFIILNLAVGGNWPGNPDKSTVFPQTMLIDYVRVYERAQPGTGGAVPHSQKTQAGFPEISLINLLHGAMHYARPRKLPLTQSERGARKRNYL